MVEAKENSLASAALRMGSPQTQLRPALDDEYEKLWSQILKNATVETGPRLRNPAISSGGLAPGVVSALQQQRDYRQAQATSSPAQAPVNAASREALGGNSRRPKPDPPCHEPLIRSVNGRREGVVFRPAAADNTYVIEGCFFGDAPGIVQLEARSGPHPSNAIPVIPLLLDSTYAGAWSDHEISVKLDPQLGGVPDYPVTLVIHRGDHRRVQLRGCRFVAARGSPQLLSMIPSAWVRLYPSAVGSRSIRQLEYVSPTEPGSIIPTDAAASSALIVRSDPDRFGIGRDNYDFTRLNPGWVVDSVRLQTYSVSCPEGLTPAQSSGGWEAAWTPLGVSIALQETVCSSTVLPSFAFSMSVSQYAIRVWVVGPVGTQPLALVR